MSIKSSNKLEFEIENDHFVCRLKCAKKRVTTTVVRNTQSMPSSIRFICCFGSTTLFNLIQKQQKRNVLLFTSYDRIKSLHLANFKCPIKCQMT